MKKRYIVAAVLILLTIPSVISNHNIFSLIPDIALVWALFTIDGVRKDGVLIGRDKTTVIATLIFNPVVVGMFYYYCWREQFPIKAKQANKYSWIVFGVWVLVVVLITVVFLGLSRTLAPSVAR